MKNIKLMNKIAPVGIEVFDKNEYNVGEDVESPIGIMLRRPSECGIRARASRYRKSRRRC